jgi:hypothetical protein
MLPTKQGKTYGNSLKIKKALKVLDLVKFLDLLKDKNSLVEVGQCGEINESSIHCTRLNSSF